MSRDERYHAIFQLAPISLWEEDFTEVVATLDAMKAQGVEDIRQHLKQNPEVLAELASMVEVLEVNDYTLELFCASSPEKLLGSLDKVFVPETYPVFLEQMVAVASNQKQFASESYVGTLDGRYIFIYLTLTMLPRDDDGRVRVLVTVMDITRRKVAEERLAAQEKLYRTMTEATPHMIWMADADSRITYCNQAMRNMVGASISEVSGRDWADVIGADEETQILRARQLARDKGTLYRGQCRFRGADGAFRSIYFIDTPVKDGVGEILNWVGIGTDITELEQAQKQLEESLDRSNRELAQIAYASSHDLQEPLRMVNSYAQLLHRRYGDKLGDQADKYIGYLTEGAQRISDLIQGLLTLSNVSQQGREPQAVDTGRLVGQVLLSLSSELQNSEAEVSHEHLPMVMADPKQTFQVFRSLLQNSIKFRSEEKLEVKIAARRVGPRWQFRVSDTGIGFDADEYGEKVFEMFRRLHTRDRYPGNGIGLALVQKIVERHGGRVWITSKPGEGTTVFFTLPAVAVEHVEVTSRTD